MDNAAFLFAWGPPFGKGKPPWLALSVCMLLLGTKESEALVAFLSDR